MAEQKFVGLNALQRFKENIEERTAPVEHTHTAEEITDLATAVQSDWNENDESAAGYVKNRTHYESEEYSVVFDCGELDFSDSLHLLTPFGSTSVTIGDTYRVYFDDVAYDCVMLDTAILGNKSVWRDGEEDTGEPFCILVGASNVYVAEYGTHTVEFGTMESVVHQLDEKYIPDLELITIEDIDTICGSSIVDESEVTF